MTTRISYAKVFPNPAYDGPQPVYMATFPWAGAERCYVRRNGKVWETARVESYGVWSATFSACPTASASETRDGGAMAFDYFHNKFFVVDGKVAVMSTGNFSKSFSIDLERNFAAVDRDPADLADLSAIFAADWAGTPLVMPCTRMVVSPINARERILDVIDGAKHTLLIESMQFADTGVREAVKRRIEAGVEVRALLADASWIDANAAAATYLQGLGVIVKSIPHLHTKVLVADGEVAYVGSENFS